jgi:DNA-3-methyladenine glycosylase II
MRSVDAPGFWADACAHLSASDRVMRRLIEQHVAASFVSRGDAFETLARSITGQQISTKAADTIWSRLLALMGSVDAAGLLSLTVEQLRSAGFSARKAEYLQDLAAHFSSGGLEGVAWEALDDEAIIQRLIAVRGVGRWTAEMFLIFHLKRADVLPLDDLGLVNGVSKAYFSGEKASRSDVRELSTAWAPYRTVGTWYIWRSLDPVPVVY